MPDNPQWPETVSALVDGSGVGGKPPKYVSVPGKLMEYAPEFARTYDLRLDGAGKLWLYRHFPGYKADVWVHPDAWQGLSGNPKEGVVNYGVDQQHLRETGAQMLQTNDPTAGQLLTGQNCPTPEPAPGPASPSSFALESLLLPGAILLAGILLAIGLRKRGA